MTLSTPRLICTHFTSREWPLYYRLVGNPAVMKYITRVALSEEKARARYNSVLEKNQLHPRIGFFSVKEKGSGDFVGLSKLEFMEAGKVEIGYALLPSQWRKGYATELVDCLLDYAKGLEDIRELIAIIDPANQASKIILERVGFSLYEKGTYGDLPAEYYHLLLRHKRG